MMIPVIVRYNLESVATLWSLQESLYVQLKHVDFKLFWKVSYDFWNNDSLDNKVQCYMRSIYIIKYLKSNFVLKQNFIFE